MRKIGTKKNSSGNSRNIYRSSFLSEIYISFFRNLSEMKTSIAHSWLPGFKAKARTSWAFGSAGLRVSGPTTQQPVRLPPRFGRPPRSPSRSPQKKKKKTLSWTRQRRGHLSAPSAEDRLSFPSAPRSPSEQRQAPRGILPVPQFAEQLRYLSFFLPARRCVHGGQPWPCAAARRRRGDCAHSLLLQFTRRAGALRSIFAENLSTI